MRCVVDTSTLVSFIINERGTVGRAVRHARDHGTLLHSRDTLTELRRKLLLPKFDPYALRSERERFIELYERSAKRSPLSKPCPSAAIRPTTCSLPWRRRAERMFC